MKCNLKLSSLLFAIYMLFFSVDARCQSNLKWEEHSNIVALSLILKSQYVILYVKNISNTPKEIIRQGLKSPFLLFYLDDQKKRIPIGGNDNSNNILKDVTNKTQKPIILPPHGEVANQFGIKISADELILIKTHSVVCSLLVYDSTTKQQFTIESLPKFLDVSP